MANIIITFLPKVQRKGTPIALPLFGPASATREDAQARINQAMASGNFVEGASVIEEIRQTPRRPRARKA